ncbi:unnamed protein product [Caenorhabditis angaria]|uniref:Seven TM Receptor n=1 Tax=Caenorhabditis angaria TaxID=860376 RepID=A0A9P1IX29_9PELO|nr:unnamed protein product [Caenorhabditis angaria]
MGSYRVLLSYTAIFELIFAILDIITAPSFFSFDSILVLYINMGNSPLSYEIMSILLTLYCGMFGISLGLFPVLFIYRYLVLTKHKLLITFESRTIICWLCIPLIFGFMFGGVSNILAAPSAYKMHHIEPYLIKSLAISKENITYLCLFFKTTTQNDQILQEQSLLAVFLMNFLVICSLIVILYFGIRCNKLINKNLLSTNLSQEYRNVQTQFFYALVVQAAIPIFLLHIPAAIILLTTVFDINLGLISGVATITIAIFPAVDPLPNVFIIKTYRTAMKLDLMIEHVDR